MPPLSHTDFSTPHEQRTIQLRDSASMLLAQLAGRIAVKNFWIEPMPFTRPLFLIYPLGFRSVVILQPGLATKVCVQLLHNLIELVVVLVPASAGLGQNP